MIYPVYIHIGDEQHAHGISIPDFPGCFSAADSWDDIPAMVQEAVELYCEGEDMTLPRPTPLEQLTSDSQYQDGIWLLIDIDTSRLDSTPKRLNISLPGGLVEEMDRYAKQHGMTRSGLIANAVKDAIRDGSHG